MKIKIYEDKDERYYFNNKEGKKVWLQTDNIEVPDYVDTKAKDLYRLLSAYKKNLEINSSLYASEIYGEITILEFESELPKHIKENNLQGKIDLKKISDDDLKTGIDLEDHNVLLMI